MTEGRVTNWWVGVTECPQNNLSRFGLDGLAVDLEPALAGADRHRVAVGDPAFQQHGGPSPDYSLHNQIY